MVKSESGEWRRASLCASGECVEMSQRGTDVMLRDSANPTVVLTCSLDAWLTFANAVRAGEFDDPA
jgi:hypothetical protein